MLLVIELIEEDMVGGRIIGLITRVIMGKVGREADGGYG